MEAGKIASQIGSALGGGLTAWIVSSYLPKVYNPHSNSTLQRGVLGLGVATAGAGYYIATETPNAVSFTIGALAYTLADTYTHHKYSKNTERVLLEAGLV
jgi:hypothetical protein